MGKTSIYLNIYCMRGPHTKARSLNDTILHNNLGDIHVAQHLHQHGFPSLLSVDDGLSNVLNMTSRPAEDGCEAVRPVLVETIHWLGAVASALNSHAKHGHAFAALAQRAGARPHA